MNKGLKVTVRICVLVALLGVVLVIAGRIGGGKLSFYVDPKNHQVTTQDRELVRGSLDPETVSSLDFSVSVADVTVEPGDSWHVEYALFSEPEITNENGVLTLRELSGEHLFSFGINTLHSSDVPHVTVTVPRDAALDRIDLQTSVGDVELTGFAAKALTVGADTGDVYLRDLALEQLTVNTDTGDLSCERVTATAATEFDTDTGDISVWELETGAFRADGNTGDIHIRALTGAQRIEIESDIGDTFCEVLGNEADYAVDLKTDLGDVEVNGRAEGQSYSTTSGSGTLKVSTDMGDIEVKFS